MRISEVSKKFDISADTLRYYERIGLVPPVNRDEKGIRDYTEEDCEWISFIKCMRAAGLSIKTLIEYVTMFQEGDSTIRERKNLLVEERQRLAERIEEMKQTLERLDKKIERYEDRLVKYEEKLRSFSDLVASGEGVLSD
ncbi:MAG TPA: MerR family transcriptional regulator [Candidatus Atribacteria bacterium]|nr:MerR family transcriptional regulator [Candidatus Atribacteria bacterium]